jgi:hypothetical protein
MKKLFLFFIDRGELTISETELIPEQNYFLLKL